MNDNQRPEAAKLTGTPIAQTKDLRSRAEAYLRGPRIISEPGASLTHLIARYMAGEPWDDPQLRNLLSKGIRTAQTKAADCEVATGPGRDARLFYERTVAILQDIQAEVLAGQV